MTEHAVVIAGGGPTGLMLAGELALAGVDVAIVERRASQELPGSRAGGLHSRTIEVLDQRGIADRFLAEGQVAQVAGFAGVTLRHQRLPHPTSLRARAVAEAHRAHPRRLGPRAGGPGPLRHRGDRLRSGRHRRRRRAVRRPVAAGGVPRRVRRRTQPGPQVGRHRLPRLGSDDERPARRGRDDRGAGAGHPPHAVGHACPGQGRVRDQGRRGGLREGGNGRGHAGRARDRHQRAHPARHPRGAHRRLRDRLRDPQPHLDHPVHRHDPAGRGVPRTDASCWPATRRTCTPPSADRASTPACRTR